jgi:hypothetical protein
MTIKIVGSLLFSGVWILLACISGYQIMRDHHVTFVLVWIAVMTFAVVFDPRNNQ